ncbi:hypothetical protein PRZ48_000395 [Zasmidium cellare]|uniref:Heterokaryon incompatibility domain-containing protein n=1 Tax=Zasmidium cellare TaxID=395010 RepID=A0ABR0F0R3_ZASCE|nr:hypothetical protein PRZ48_000395 [Zasmidium cellare]
MAVYTSLQLQNDQTSFRLFTLHGSTNQDAPITGSLSVASLDEKPSYEALSYCWGSPENGEDITLNDDKVLHVTPNLASALRALRLQHKSRVVWIDAICINQTSDDEKNFQVLLMRRIYSTCSRSVIWLGPSDAASRKAFRFMQRSSKEYSNLIKSVLVRPWFRRVWIIQEVAFPPEIDVQCGEDKISWESLAHACSLVSRSVMMVDVDAPKDAKHFHPTFYPKVLDATRQKIIKGERFSPLDALRSFRTFQATNGLDKVYGLLGLVDDPSFVTVDYSKSVQEIFREVAITSMRSSGRLAVLGECLPQETPSKPGWESWVPDWTDSEQTVEQDVGVLSARNNVFRASCDTTADVTLEQDGSLQISGHFIATVAEVAPPWKSVEELRDMILPKGRILPRKRGYELPCYFVDLYKGWLDVARRVNGESGTLQDKYITNESVLEAWYNMYYNTAPPLSDFKDARRFDLWAHSIELGFAALSWWQRNLVQKLPWVLIYIVSGPYIFTVCVATLFLIISGRLILEPPPPPETAFRSLWDTGRTDNGLIGKFPAPTFLSPKAAATKPGDAVVILKGGARPFVLRAEGKKWRIVGDAYVHGIMHGAAFDESKCASFDLV